MDRDNLALRLVRRERDALAALPFPRPASDLIDTALLADLAEEEGYLQGLADSLLEGHALKVTQIRMPSEIDDRIQLLSQSGRAAQDAVALLSYRRQLVRLATVLSSAGGVALVR